MTHSYNSKIHSQIESFPSLPITATKVLSVTSNPESSADDLMRVILPDQIMCSVILKVANSAFFGIPREVASIERAIVVLGYEEIRNIVIGKAVLGSLPKLPRETREALGPFWEHAFTCGLAAKIIGEHLKISPGELFVAGLIHDIGKIVMLLAFPNEYPLLRDISKPSNGHCTTEERASFGMSHDEAGLRLARKWLLPEQLMMPVGFHHSPQDASACIQYPLIVQAADIISLIHCHPDKIAAEDVDKIFNGFLPDIAARWQSNNLFWNPENLGLWFETLEKYREREQGFLSILSSD